VIAKILEKLVSGQLSAHLQSNNVLHPHQGAYQHGKSTSDILLVAVDSITSFLDNVDSVCAALVDLHKAFDSLDHSILLKRLSNLDLSRTVLNWFKDYFTARHHHVKFNNQYSSWNLMEGGIPQGSALGPLLFLIYMNTLPDVVDDVCCFNTLMTQNSFVLVETRWKLLINSIINYSLLVLSWKITECNLMSKNPVQYH